MQLKLPSNTKSFLLVLQTPLEVIYTLLVIRLFGVEAYGTFQKLILPSSILIQFTSFGINPAILFLLNKSYKFNSLIVVQAGFLLQLPLLLILAIPSIFYRRYLYALSGLSDEWNTLLLITTLLVVMHALSKPFYFIVF